MYLLQIFVDDCVLTYTNGTVIWQCERKCDNDNITCISAVAAQWTGGARAPPLFQSEKINKKCNFFCNFVIQKSLDELICLEILPKFWPKFLIFSWKVLYILDFWINCICMFFVTIISCLLPFISGKLLKNPKNIKDFKILDVCFFVTIISCLLPFISGKLLKNPKNIKDFKILEVCFPAMWRLKF